MSLDVAFYLGQILMNLKQKVLIADLTGTGGLYAVFSDNNNTLFTYRNVDYVSKEFDIIDNKYDIYDCVIVCLKDSPRSIHGNMFSKVYFISDTQYTHIFKLLYDIKNTRTITGIILRDVTDNGINGKYIFNYYLKDDFASKIYSDGRVYEIQDDLIDREYRLQMQYGSPGKFSGLSKGFLNVLKIIITELTGMNKDYIAKAIKNAKEGKIIEKYSILEQCSRKKRNKW